MVYVMLCKQLGFGHERLQDYCRRKNMKARPSRKIGKAKKDVWRAFTTSTELEVAVVTENEIHRS